MNPTVVNAQAKQMASIAQDLFITEMEEIGISGANNAKALQVANHCLGLAEIFCNASYSRTEEFKAFLKDDKKEGGEPE